MAAAVLPAADFPPVVGGDGGQALPPRQPAAAQVGKRGNNRGPPGAGRVVMRMVMLVFRSLLRAHIGMDYSGQGDGCQITGFCNQGNCILIRKIRSVRLSRIFHRLNSPQRELSAGKHGSFREKLRSIRPIPVHSRNRLQSNITKCNVDYAQSLRCNCPGFATRAIAL